MAAHLLIPIQRKNMNIHRIRRALTDLEAAGLIQRTGEYRRDPKGELQPVYACVEMPEAEAQRRLQLLSDNDSKPAQSFLARRS
jgi:hypothetical protein